MKKPDITHTIVGWIEEGELRLSQLPPGVKLIIDSYDDVNMNDHPGEKVRVLRHPPVPEEDGFFRVVNERPFRRMIYELNEKGE